MLLCLDIGNTHIFGGVVHQETILARFRHATHLLGTADQFGIFLQQVLKARRIDTEQIQAVAICSVVPSCEYTIKHAISMYIHAPLFQLRAGVKTGLNIKYKNPGEVGADRIANAIAAINLFANQNLIIIDLGTATTLCGVNKHRDYLGGSILPGIRLAMESLKNNTAKLMEVGIEIPTHYIGRTTHESIQNGLYYGQLGALKELIAGFNQEVFKQEPAMVIGTGGFAQLYKDKSLFDVILPDLVLQGLAKAYEYNEQALT